MCTRRNACCLRNALRLPSHLASFTRLHLEGRLSPVGCPPGRHFHDSVAWQGVDEGAPPRFLVVQPRQYPPSVLKARLTEALRLTQALGAPRGPTGGHGGGGGGGGHLRDDTPWVVVQSPGGSWSRKLRSSAGTYFGQGTIESVKAHIHAQDSLGREVDSVFVNAQLTGIQQRNLEDAWGKHVVDRVGLIIDIFGAHAQTREAKLQVEMAALAYQKSRLVRSRTAGGERSRFGSGGEQEVVSARGRGGGGQGFLSGAGEPELQLQRRRIAEKQGRLSRQLADVRRTRALHRAARRRRSLAGGGAGRGLPVVAVVGYTNAGKSTLVGALSDQPLYADDRLFATLDPRLRGVTLPSGRRALLSDTVGFISNLPVALVEAFKATLEEVLEADLILHVVDGSAADAAEQRAAVLEVLEGMGVRPEALRRRVIESWNKVDLIEVGDGFGPSTFLAGHEDRDFGTEDGSFGAEEDPMAAHSMMPTMLLDAPPVDMSPVGYVDTREPPASSCFPSTRPSRIQGPLGLRHGDQLCPLAEEPGVPRVVTSALRGFGLDRLLAEIDGRLGLLEM